MAHSCGWRGGHGGHGQRDGLRLGGGGRHRTVGRFVGRGAVRLLQRGRVVSSVDA